jgi:hypothetical protein
MKTFYVKRSPFRFCMDISIRTVISILHHRHFAFFTIETQSQFFVCIA